MPVPVGLAAVGVAKKAPKPSADNAGMYLLGGLALVWLVKEGIIDPFRKLGAGAGDFGSGFFNQSRYDYADDQSGSPNPPSLIWWEQLQDDGPIPVNAGSILSTPTPPVMTADPMTGGRDAGKATNRWFTNPILYPWFAFAEKTAESASEKTNADYFNEG
jgi:hypothetical protein